MNLIDTIFEAMHCDDADTDKQSELLKNLYADATQGEKQAIDDVLICLCGWSLTTMNERNR